MNYTMRSLLILSKYSPRSAATNLEKGVLARYCSSETTEPRYPKAIEKSINQVSLLGRCGNSPELRGSAEYPVVQFSLATHINYFKGGESLQSTVWHRISVFKPGLRELVLNSLLKGQRVYVQGKLGYYEKKDPQSDLVVNKTASIVADEVILFNPQAS